MGLRLLRFRTNLAVPLPSTESGQRATIVGTGTLMFPGPISLSGHTGMLPGLKVIWLDGGRVRSISFVGRISGSSGLTVETALSTLQLAGLKPSLKNCPLCGVRLKPEVRACSPAFATAGTARAKARMSPAKAVLINFMNLSLLSKSFPPGRCPGPVSPNNPRESNR